MGHYWRDMDPEGAAEQDRKYKRISEIRKKIGSMSLGEFTVDEFVAVARILGLVRNSIGELEPDEEHLRLLEKKKRTVRRAKKVIF